MKISRHFAILTLTVVCLCLPVWSQKPESANRITGPVDETERVTLQGNVHPMARAEFDRGAAPASMATGRIELVLQRSAAQQQALTQYLADVQNASSPSYHKWLTPAQYGAAFGVSDSDLETVESWLASHGFKIEKVPQARNVIQFSGTVSQIQSAFSTSIHSFSVRGEMHYANVSDPQIPAALAPVVVGVTPLNDFRPKASYVKGPSGHYDAETKRIEPDLTLTSGSTPLLFMDPADAATIYDMPNTNLNANYTSGTSYDGTGVNIGIVGTSDLTTADVQNYRVAFLGETAANVNLPTVIVDGNDPGLVQGADVEALLDNEVSGGIAPKAKVYFYTSADSDLASGLFNAVLRAVDDNAVGILSMSFGECEAGLGNSTNQFLLETAEQAAAQGISWTVSAGDGGSAGCDNFDTETAAQYGLAVNGMASTPWTIAVGGTDFDGLGAAFSTYVNATTSGTAPYYRTALKYIPENPWNDSTTVDTTYAANVAYVDPSSGQTNIVAGSGGVSTVYAKPSFQTSLTPNDGARDLPDVSFFASDGFNQALWLLCSDNVTNGDTTQTYTDCLTTNGALTSNSTFDGVGGTSAAAPAFAGMLALVSQAQGGARLGQADYVLYQLAASKYATVFHDVTIGNNSVPCVAASTNCGTNHFLTGYNAGTGYDTATGLGSIDMKQLIQNWSTVTLKATTTTLKINGSTAAYTGTHGASLTFDTGVNPTTATGAVAIVDTANETSGGTVSGPQNNGQFGITLASGAGTATYNGLPGGTYTVTGRYSGDAADASSTSTPITVTIAAEPSTTTLQVNAYNAITEAGVSSLTSVPYGSYVFADAQVLGTGEGANTEGIATGTVTYLDGSSTLGTAALSGNGNLASWPALKTPYTVFPVGSHSVTAKYAGDASFSASTSSAVPFTVVKATTTTAATANPTSISSTGTSTATVTITTAYNLGANPTGSVALTANGNTVGTISSLTTTITGTYPNLSFVTTGTGTINGSALASGANTVTATYSGDANYGGSSSTVTLTVAGSSGGTGGFSLTSAGNITVNPGATSGNTSVITVTPSGGFTGQVNLTCAVTTSITNPNDPPTCTIASNVSITGTTAGMATLIVSTTASSTSAVDLPLKRFFVGGGGALLAMMLFFGVPARRRAWRTLFGLLAVVVVTGAIGCGGGGSGGGGGGNTGTTAGAYTVTVTGTDKATGKIIETATVTVTVN